MVLRHCIAACLLAAWVTSGLLEGNNLHAKIINGSFETGNFDHWQASAGSIVTDEIHTGIKPTDLDYLARLLTSDGESELVSGASRLPSDWGTKYGVSRDSIDLLDSAAVLAGAFAVKGAIIGQTFGIHRIGIGIVDAGDDSFGSALVVDNFVFDSNSGNLSFDWKLLTDDPRDLSFTNFYNDFAFVSFDGQLSLLGDLTSISFSSDRLASGYFEASWKHYDSVAGMVAVPEPSTFVVVGLFGTFMCFVGVRRRAKSQMV